MSSLKFWDAAASETYDVYVLGKRAPEEIKLFLAEEDEKLDEVIDNYINKKKNTVFVEIGSGTGRYMMRYGARVILNENYRKYLKYIIGIDFSKQMIETCIRNLSLTRVVRGERLSSIVEKLSIKTGIPLKDIREQLLRRVYLINADANKACLKISGEFNVVIGIMFGTLGNIADVRKTLANVSEMMKDDGSLVVTVFNERFADIGFNLYDELANRGFQELRGITWTRKNHGGSFTTETGFLSHWFTEEEFRELVKKHFSIKNIHLVSKRGLMAIAKSKRRKRLLRMPTRIKERGIDSSSVNLLCPNCGEVLGMIQLESNELHCAVCNKNYVVENHHGFRVPILVEPQNPLQHEKKMRT